MSRRMTLEERQAKARELFPHWTAGQVDEVTVSPHAPDPLGGWMWHMNSDAFPELWFTEVELADPLPENSVFTMWRKAIDDG